MQKPTAPACQRNRQPILQVLMPALADAHQVLEIGSGTGEHAVYFAGQMPWLSWQCSDLAENIAGIQLWVDEANLPGLLQPMVLDVASPTISKQYDAVFTANSLHIMSMPRVEDFFQLVTEATSEAATLIVYGPFKFNGAFTSDSNAQFETWLKQRDPQSGIRDFEWIDQLANDAGFKLQKIYDMPANNYCLHWRTQTSQSNCPEHLQASKL